MNLTKELLILLSSSKMTYDEYITKGKTFLYSKKLRSINEQILDLMNEPNFEKNKELEEPSLDLKQHIEEWIVFWDKEQSIKNPKDNDVFIFKNYKRYPKDLELLLIKQSK